MKKLFVVIVIAIALGMGIYWAVRPASKTEEPPAATLPALSPDEAKSSERQKQPDRSTQETGGFIEKRRAAAQAARAAREATAEVPDEKAIVRQTVAWLVSPLTSFEEKQAGWRRLMQEGKLADVVKELEQQVTEHPTDVEYRAALGEGYIYQISGVKEMREQAMLGMKADESFDAALKIDPNHWEARFFKTTAMSYWPESLNKGGEVIGNFKELIAMQEAQSPQPQFAQTYAWLGEQYKKAGRIDEAQQVWQRGAALFPTDRTLKSKLAGSPTSEQSR